ncbi:MAG TPA: type II toxin-antitoxin system HicB family antitoxin [Candidatus Sulfotelmatobacter sp.]|jgi:predicted RNase H-like HicB family nuclease|nr:type II toxin-antitoxin system HicB family antitoxin [Candidatus Sulfotelmatobacter sp.]
MKVLIVVEKARTGYSAYSPDLPGCAATGPTRQRTVARMRAAIRFHVEGLRATGQRIPRPTSSSTYVVVPA